MKDEGNFEFQVSDPGSKTSARLILSGTPSEKTLGQFFDFFRKKITQMPVLLGDTEGAELAELKRRPANGHTQASYERMVELENKKKRTPVEIPEEEEPETVEEPTPKKAAVQEMDLENLSEEDRAIATKNPNLMSQKEWEKFRSLTEKKKEPSSGGGMFSGKLRRPAQIK